MKKIGGLMPKLFHNEYHEHSNTWYFRDRVFSLQKDDIVFQRTKDENGKIIFKFEAVTEKKKIFPPVITIIYDKKEDKIVKNECSRCKNDDLCKHYLSIIKYAYTYYTTDDLNDLLYQTYESSFMIYDEYWQRMLMNSRIDISDIFDIKTDKIRFHFKNYGKINIYLVSMLVADRDVDEYKRLEIVEARKVIGYLSEAEISLLVLLQKYKCSYSHKTNFFTIYKKDFSKILPAVKALNKIFINETGDRINFTKEKYAPSFQVIAVKKNKYIFKATSTRKISAFFTGNTTYIFQKNDVYEINFPFSQEVVAKLFKEGYPVQEKDLFFLRAVVSRQLSLLNCYLDFDENVPQEDFFNIEPTVTFSFSKLEDSIKMECLLDYGDGVYLPLSLTRFNSELVSYPYKDGTSWFYIPSQTHYEVEEFFSYLTLGDQSLYEKESVLIFSGSYPIESLKKIVFEKAKSDWNILLAEELKSQFIYRVKLQPEIIAKKTSRSDWFEYNVTYKYKDISLTHAELKKFFSSTSKFLKLDDGRLLFLTNRNIFQEVESVIKVGEEQKENVYNMPISKLPYIYQLSRFNSDVNFDGDDFVQEMFKALINRKLEDNKMLPQNVRAVLRSYQKAGFRWIKMLEKFKLNGILADEMGLGKTIQAIAILSDLPSDSKSVVVCPKTLLYNWAAEIDKFNPSLSYIILEGSKEERLKALKNKQVNIFFVSYAILANDLEQFKELEFDYIILDEAQHIKNANTLRSKAVKELNSKHKLALTGTPIENNSEELWSIFDFLMKGYLPPSQLFKKIVTDTKMIQGFTAVKMQQMLAPFILRRKKQDVLIELPDKQEQTIFCKMNPVQEKLYLQVLENIKQNVLNKSGKELNKHYMNILSALMKLRQICNHPALIEPKMKDDIELSAKTETLREIILDAVENDQKILIFSQFVKMLNILRKIFKDNDIQYEYMDGSTKNRMKVVDNFNNNENVRAFLISLKTGGYGLNLTSADTVIIADPWWNPMSESQAIDRAHRIGQTKKVIVYKMITKGTVEEKILKMQKDKKDLFDSLIEGSQSSLKNMSGDDLKSLFEYSE